MSLTRVTLATASSVLLLAALAGCGNNDGDHDTAAAAPDTNAQGAPPQGGGIPGTSGEIAAISGKTMQVQSDASGQVAVSWTDKTTFSQQVDASLDDVAVGSCVMVMADSASDGTGDSTSDDSGPVAATSVRITKSTDGDCAGGFRGGPGGQPTDMPSDMPSDVPSDMPTDMPNGGPGGGPMRMGGAFGKVTAVSANGFTVAAAQPGSDDTSDREVTVSSDTTYSKNADANASALKVGRCVSASGDTDDTGAVTADRVDVSDAVDGQCAVGMMVQRSGANQ